ncbi:MAG: hypothetical protein WD793_04660 [Steroidobacteraceae bacterium]
MTMKTTRLPPIWRFSIFVLLAACVACSKKGEDPDTTTAPDRLSINVTVIGGQTVSKFVVRERGRVTFYNKGERELTLLFKNEKQEKESPFCHGSKPEDNPIRIDAGDDEKLTICPGMARKWFKYTAGIDGAAEEDPIIWVE